MATNGTVLVCPAQCPDPMAWKGQLIAGACGLAALALVLGTVIWVTRLLARQARLKDPQMVVTSEYLQQREEAKKAEKRTWLQFWAKKGVSLKKPMWEVLPILTKGASLAVDETTNPKKEKKLSPPRPTVLCSGTLATLPPGELPLVQKPNSTAHVEFVAPRGLHLPHQPDAELDVLSGIKNAIKGKKKV
ncbi:hypothetical protein Pdw03_1494 [Penicillium digitatum]|uniref:Uncharacterized protein n=3 Tax=Penicillium digitatum TaxID=36651 RepID=K9GUR9_PEND2|nr:hypothetical protein PDIP_40320 [Penicillium digitatum Pd1]EKV15579.1 hypothetical protein PDIP_40320 [Penicillium digitatum Pd1]EKV18348.1 hypothetical protein PDIG_10280 [Penicillium digitatum PHI26]QQK46596.1 hypothetical protein Pdw03_1494 [Penicillium digitatum]